MIITIICIILILIIGRTVMKILGISVFKTVIEELPYNFAVGIGAVGMELYIYSRVGVEWNLFNFVLPWVVLIIARNPFRDLQPMVPKLNLQKKEIILLIILTVTILYVAFESVLRPLTAWDGWSIWLLKSNIFYIDGMIKPDVFQYVESDYPLMISLICAFVYTILGKIDDTSILFLFFSFYLFLLIAFYFQVKKHTSVFLALLMTFLLASTQNILRHGGRLEAGQADLALAFFMFLSVASLMAYQKENNKKNLILCNILLGLTALIKNEGLTFSIILELILSTQFILTKSYRDFLYSLFWLVPVLDWEIYKVIYNIPKNFLIVVIQFHLERIPLLLKEFMLEFINIQRWNLLWVTFFFITITQNIRFKKHSVIWILLIGQLAVYFIVYLITPVDPVPHIRSSLNRLLIHLTPLAVLLIAITMAEINKSYKVDKILRSYKKLLSF